MENSPIWLDVIFCSFLLATLLGLLFCLFRRRRIIFSLFALFALITAPLTFMLVALGRAENFNEFEWLIHEAVHGSPIAIYSVAGFLYLFLWWGLILKNTIKWTRTRIIILCIAAALLISAYPVIHWIDELTRSPISIQNYSFIYSHPFDGTSYFITTQSGKHFVTNPLDVGDIESIQSNRIKSGSYYLISTHAKAYYLLEQHSTKLIEEKTPQPLTFLVNGPKLTIMSYNESVNHNVLHVDDGRYQKKYNLPFTGYLETALYTDQSIYVLNDSIDKDQSVVAVINRENGKVIKQIKLNENAMSLIRFNDKLVIDTRHQLSTIDLKDNYHVKRVNYPTEPDAPSNSLYVFNNNLYATFVDQNERVHVWKVNENFKTLSDKKIDLPSIGLLSSIKFSNRKLYLLTQYNGDEKGTEAQFGGKFTAYNIDTLKQEFSFRIPKRKVKVQDFVVR
ncbi:hypothetical protein [Sporolactobacillus terrae]|uniref:Uncharacterized protein n=1 Tax=Sporolactobacillus terrae TaxID=269673 RepID=A0ABX5Q5A8_9BACL|nr:hypothetical protein [Sporolactobacillus terrae]QAA21830.1 hypothetical protein C0674_03905 [Sporolactobacillus terrae]QAA24803.1 hypothetical protein C0679_03880 [Sporolactobacillus terrae]UAK16628.1 hypothetical protein K7399_01235 [Sporolactobacillus terrae]